MTTYRTAHNAVRAVHGPASGHPCWRCGKPAAHWAYDHRDADALVDDQGRVYSASTKHYGPMCRQCHVSFDRSLTSLHIIALVINRECGGCRARPGQFCSSPSGQVYSHPGWQHVSRTKAADLYRLRPPPGARLADADHVASMSPSRV